MKVIIFSCVDNLLIMFNIVVAIPEHPADIIDARGLRM